MVLVLLSDFLKTSLVLRKREREREKAGEGQREREIQNPKQAPGSELSTQSLVWGLNPQTVRS